MKPNLDFFFRPSMESSDFSDSSDSDDSRKEAEFIQDSSDGDSGKNTMSFHRLNVWGSFVTRKWGLSVSLSVCLSTLV